MKLLVLLLTLLVPNAAPPRQPHFSASSPDKVVQGTEITMEIENEFITMTRELVALNNPEVNKVITPHVEKLYKLAEQREALVDGQ